MAIQTRRKIKVTKIEKFDELTLVTVEHKNGTIENLSVDSYSIESTDEGCTLTMKIHFDTDYSSFECYPDYDTNL